MSTPKPGLSITMKTPPAYRTNPELYCHVKPPVLPADNGRAIERWHWTGTSLEVRTLSQMEIVKK